MKNLKKLAYDSPASQDGWEVWQMLQQVVQIKPKIIVEIGCDGGGFLDTLSELFPQAKIIGIDINERKELYPYRMIFGDSQDTAVVGRLQAAIRPAKIDFLFIDGDHHYKAVKKEFELYRSLVREGGIIGFHDTNNRGIDGVEVDRFMREMDEAFSFRTMDLRTDRFSPGTRLIWV